MKSRSGIFQRSILWIGIVLFSIGAGLFAYAGSFSRLWADDYCYSAIFKQYPFFQAQGIWWQTGGNRFATLPIVAFSDVFGYYAPAVMPFLQIMLLVAAVFTLLNTLLTMDLISWQRSTCFFAALGVAYYLFLLAPDRLQTLYWRMGALHYTLPISFALLNAALLLWASQKKKSYWSWVWMVVSGLLGWYTAGFSETFAALQTGLLALLMLVLTLKIQRNRWKVVRWLLLPLLGSLAAMALMVASPSNEWRQAALPPPASLWIFISLSLRYALDFIWYSLKAQPLPNLAFMSLAGALALWKLPNRPEQVTARWLLWLAAAVLLPYALIVCVTAPSVFAGSQYPAGRALMPARFVLLIGEGILAVLISRLFPYFLNINKKIWQTVGLVILIIAMLYTARSFTIPLADASTLSVKAERWDGRHAQILFDIENGNQDLTVKMTDVVQSLEDIGQDSQHWINKCAAGYYQVESITAKP